MKCEYCGAEYELNMVGYGSDHDCPNIRTITTNSTVPYVAPTDHKEHE